MRLTHRGCSSAHLFRASLVTQAIDEKADRILLFETAFALPDLFNSPITHAEVGVYNRWNSAGARKVWHCGTAIPTVSELLPRLSLELRRMRGEPVMLEAAFADPVAHWIGLNVSVRRGQRFMLHVDTLHERLKTLLRSEIRQTVS